MKRYKILLIVTILVALAGYGVRQLRLHWREQEKTAAEARPDVQLRRTLERVERALRSPDKTIAKLELATAFEQAKSLDAMHTDLALQIARKRIDLAEGEEKQNLVEEAFQLALTRLSDDEDSRKQLLEWAEIAQSYAKSPIEQVALLDRAGDALQQRLNVIPAGPKTRRQLRRFDLAVARAAEQEPSLKQRGLRAIRHALELGQDDGDMADISDNIGLLASLIPLSDSWGALDLSKEAAVKSYSLAQILDLADKPTKLLPEALERMAKHGVEGAPDSPETQKQRKTYEDKALEHWRKLGNQEDLRQALALRAHREATANDFETASQHFEEALSTMASKPSMERSQLLGNLAHCLDRTDKTAEAKRFAQESYEDLVSIYEARGTQGAEKVSEAEIVEALALSGLRHARLLRRTPSPNKKAALQVCEKELRRIENSHVNATTGRLKRLVDGLHTLQDELTAK